MIKSLGNILWDLRNFKIQMWIQILFSLDMIGYPSQTHPMGTLKPDPTADQTNLQIILLHQILQEFISDQMKFKLQMDLKSNTPVSKTTFQTAKIKNHWKNARSWKRRENVRKKELPRSVRRLAISARKLFTTSLIFPFQNCSNFQTLTLTIC